MKERKAAQREAERKGQIEQAQQQTTDVSMDTEEAARLEKEKVAEEKRRAAGKEKVNYRRFEKEKAAAQKEVEKKEQERLVAELKAKRIRKEEKERE